MLKNDSNKNYIMMALFGMVLILLVLLIKKWSDVTSPEAIEQPGDIAEIISEEEPLQIPDDFKNFLKSKKIITMTFGDEKGRIRLVSVDGRYINPCLTKTLPSSSQPTYRKESLPCRFEAGLGETHILIASRAGVASISTCGTCQGNGISRACAIKKKKYGCNSPIKTCETTCY